QSRQSSSLGVESGPRFLSFPWIGLDRSGTTVRRVTPSTPAGPSKFLAEIYITSKAIRRNGMNQSTKDEIKGNLHEAKGTVKEKAGQVTNNPNLTAEGQNEKLAGKVQKKVGQIEKVLEK
ncbi:MAG: CsbD family protein, partial [Candidatus Sulfotelmatobacter sp.]